MGKQNQATQWMATAAMARCMSQQQEPPARNGTNTWTKTDQGTPVRKIHLHTQLYWAQQLQQVNWAAVISHHKVLYLGQP